MRLFDCILYNGEIETLEIRLHELDPVIDVFVIVEATQTFSGLAKPLRLRSQWARIRPFARKIRYVVLDDEADFGPEPAGHSSSNPALIDPWARERFQRNSVVRGLLDIDPTDFVLLSDVDEIPRARVLETIRAQVRETDGLAFGLVLTLSYFALNYVHTAGPEVDLMTAVVVPAALLAAHAPDILRHGIRSGAVPAIRVREAGWHFSYLSDRSGIAAKIQAFSHQEFNTAAFLESLDPAALIAGKQDLFGRPDYVWTIADGTDLPVHVRDRREAYAHRLLTTEGEFTTGPLAPPAAPIVRQEPVILCPYVRDADRDRVVAAFGLETERGRHLPFHLWQDHALQGPERAFAQGWAQFPDRDVIILHTDMAPMPDDMDNGWYTRLLEAVEALPSAGLIGCDLLYPLQAETGAWYVQCAGGFFSGETLGHIGGHVDLRTGAAGPEAVRYDTRFAKPRPVDWVTFGGVYLRREVIDMVGDFDPEYRWAYVMDTDYALEATIRGSGIYQVPVTLLHEENGSTRHFLNDPRYSEAVAFNYARFQEKWGTFLRRRAAAAAEGRNLPPGAPSPEASPAEPNWLARNAAAMLAEAHIRHPGFITAAYARALAPADPDAVTAAEIEAAYLLILDRAADPGARAAWQGEVARRTVGAAELVAQLCESAEFASLTRRLGLI